jgi:hypothetical protein
MKPAADISRAKKALLENHGTNAARVAEKRAETAERSGSTMAAHTWRQIAVAIRGDQNRPSF